MNRHQEDAENPRLVLDLLFAVFFSLLPDECHEIDNERNVLEQLTHNIGVEVNHQQENVNNARLESMTTGFPTTTAALSASDCFRRIEKR